MRPKKNPDERRKILVNVRLTDAESEQFRAQAAARTMELGPYLRYLAMADGESLVADGKIRRTAEAEWEVLKMGTWSKP